MPEVLERVRSVRKLPKLKDLDITIDGEQVLPVSVSLAKVGFDGKNGSFAVEDTPIIQKLISRTSKFHYLDTIKTHSKTFFACPDRFLDALILVISKLPHLRELDLTDSKDAYPPPKQIFNILDILAKAPKFEILRLGLQIKGVSSQISLLKHPLFKAKSLKRTSFSLFFYEDTAPEDLNKVFDLLGGMPSLYGLCLDFSSYTSISDETVEDLMKKMSGMTSIRKLKIHFAELSGRLGAKQAGNIVRWTFNKMVFLEELDLKPPKNCLELGEHNDIQGLPRLRKASLHMENWKSEKENEIRGAVEILGKCQGLRELELFLKDSVRDCQGMTMKLCESLRKLKELQVFRLYATAEWRYSNMTQDLMWEFLMTWNRMRSLQDLTVFMGMNPHERSLNYGGLYNQLANNKKYRCFLLGY